MIIESTLTPKQVDDVVLKIIKSKGLRLDEEIMIGVAPRRDWFHSPEKNVKNLNFYQIIG